MMNEPKARRVKDACAALGIHRSTLYKLASKGKVKLVHIAGRTVVPESEIVRLASHGTGPQLSPQKGVGLRRWRADNGGHAKGKSAKIPQRNPLTAHRGAQE